jgi:hypothetical protein
MSGAGTARCYGVAVMGWKLLGGLAVGGAYLVGRAVVRRASQGDAARAAGLEPGFDLSHVPAELQATALWSLADGGFERRVVQGTLARPHGDVAITAFDLETLRESRGEWAYLPVDLPFRIAGLVSVVVCEIARAFPHVLLKRAGQGDELADDSYLERLGSVTKTVRDRLGVSRSYASELPGGLPERSLDLALPEGWRGYTHAPELVETMLPAGLADALVRAGRRDLVIELLDRIVVVYPAARDVVGPDAFADLTATALAIVDGVLAATPAVTPRGLEP